VDEDGAAVKRLWLLLVFGLMAAPAANAHVGSKDVFEQVSAGPYNLFITIRPPNVIPGVAIVEVRATGAAITSLKITPMPLTGEASKHPPTADTLKRSDTDPNFYTGGVWMMASGSWQVRFEVDGAGGHQITSVPVPAVALTTLKMQRELGVPLALLGVFLVVSMAGVVAAAIREARLQPGVRPTLKLRRRGLIAMTASLIVMTLMVYGGAKWWNVEAASYADDVYRPMTMQAQLNGDQLDLNVQPFVTGTGRDRRTRSNADFLPDHGHLMHLYVIREPQMDAVFHLHPELVSTGDFRIALPSMPAGSYKLYGDVVHANGFPETLLAGVEIPAKVPVRICAGICPDLGPDDAEALPAPLSAGALGLSYKLPDGYTMVWDKPSTLTASTAHSLHFKLLAPDGTLAKDMRPYMGMTGHAAFIKDDGAVFAHTHPEGSAAMAALDIANGSMSSMSGMASGPTPPEIDFPYGFPTPGAYRIIIQMKHGGTIETGVFDATVQ
jgi:hypothetical protein